MKAKVYSDSANSKFKTAKFLKRLGARQIKKNNDLPETELAPEVRLGEALPSSAPGISRKSDC